jgi:hypothetical protein
MFVVHSVRRERRDSDHGGGRAINSPLHNLEVETKTISQSNRVSSLFVITIARLSFWFSFCLILAYGLSFASFFPLLYKPRQKEIMVEVARRSRGADQM